ncbi:MAG: C25 family cysteine peptidase [Anaerolineales bacterium]
MNGSKFLVVTIPFCLLLAGCANSGILPVWQTVTETATETPTTLPPTLTSTLTRTSTPTLTPTVEPLDVVIGRIVNGFSEDPGRNILVLVHPNLYFNLEQELAVFESDLRAENWVPVITTLQVSSPQEMRQALQTIYSQRAFAGVFLVGDFPYERMWGYPIKNPNEPGPADYYYMDLDGEWMDTNKDKFYDVHTNGQGDRDPEIFVGRLSASNVDLLDEPELELMKAYFRRNHAYRTGNLATRNAAVYAAPADHHYGWYAWESAFWSQNEIKSMQALYPLTFAFIFNERAHSWKEDEWASEFWLVGSTEEKTTAPATFMLSELMGDGYDYLSIGIHGWQLAWAGLFTNQDVVDVHTSGGQLPILVVSNSCSTGDISTADSMGGVISMAGAMVFVGYSAPSEMRWEEFVLWNKSLKEKPIGEAFLKLQDFATPFGYGAVTRNVNWILLGDPTLHLRATAS